MSNVDLIASRVNQVSASLAAWNRAIMFVVAAAAIAVALYFVASYIMRNKTVELENARDELTKLEIREQALRISKVETDSEERAAKVKAEIEDRMAVLAAMAAKTESEIAKANEKVDAEKLERMREETEIEERLTELAAMAAKTESEIAKANEKAEARQLERVRLEAGLAPRTIEQRRSAKELQQFKGMNVVIESLAEAEAWRTAGQIAWLLSNASWNISPGMKRSLDTRQFRDGIIIETNGEDRVQGEDRSLPAARALIEVLGRNKIQTDWRPSTAHLPQDTIKIRVGLKPFDYPENNSEDSSYGNVLYK